MIITLIPQRRDTTLVVSRAGDTLLINGEEFDFSVIPDGASLPGRAVPCAMIEDLSIIDRIDGVLHLSLYLPLGANPPPEARFPAPIVNPPDGPIDLPVTHIEPEADNA